MKDVSSHILDIVQNSIRAEATLIKITVEEDESLNTYEIKIEDNGCGMEDQVLRQVQDPFFTTRTTRKVGLGISLFKQNAEQTGGFLKIESKLGLGTIVHVQFGLNHVDRQPIGDIKGVLTLLFTANPTIDFIYIHRTKHGEYEFNTIKIKEILNESYTVNSITIGFIKDMIDENLNELQIRK